MLLEKVRIVLNDIKEEGLKNVFRRHKSIARANGAAVQTIGLSMVAPDKPADIQQEYLLPMVWMEAS